MRGFLKTDVVGGGGIAKRSLAFVCVFAGSVWLGGLTNMAWGQATGVATNYFRPWTMPGVDADLSNDWTDSNEPSAQGSPGNLVPGEQWVRYVDSVNGSDSQLGLTQQTALRSIAKAWELLQPLRTLAYGNAQAPINARIRLIRNSVFDGETLDPFAGNGVNPVIGGRGPAEPLVIEAWPRPGMPGGDGRRPIIRIPVDAQGHGVAPAWLMIGTASNSHQNEWAGDIWIIGLEITSQLIPSGRAAGEVPTRPQRAFIKAGSTGARYLLEDLYVHDVSSIFAFDGNDTGPGHEHDYMSGVTVRRCVCERAYDRSDNRFDGPQLANHSGGGYFSNCKWVLFEENSMDQMGWNNLQGHRFITEWEESYQAGGLSPSNVFNHALYIPASSENVLIRGNIFARASHNAIQLRGNRQRAENNLVLGCPVGISLGHGQNQGQPPCGFYDYDIFVAKGWPLPPGCGPSNPVISCWDPVGNACPVLVPPTPPPTTHFAYTPYFWRGQCKFNVILNGANIDRWITNSSGQTVGIEPNGDARGRGLTLSRCRMRDDNDISYDYCEQSQLITSGPNIGGYAVEIVRAGNVYKNLLANNDDGREEQGAGILCDDDADAAPNPDWIQNYQAHVHSNIVYNWLGANPKGTLALHINNGKTFSSNPSPQLPFCLPDSEGPLGSGFVFENNDFIQDGPRRIARARWNPVSVGATTWVNNRYFSLEKEEKRYQVQRKYPPIDPFELPRDESSFLGEDGWQEATQETTSGELAFPPAYPDPSRNLYTYIKYELGWEPDGLTQTDWMIQFMGFCSQQHRGDWNTDLTAAVVNNYMRDGFGIVYSEDQLCP